jgi:Rieske Fe-S protein
VAASTQWEAITLGVGLLALGFGVTAWGKYLMPQGPFVEERHAFHSTEAERQAMTAAITERGGMVVKRRRPAGRPVRPGSTAMGIVLACPPLRSLGPKPRLRQAKHHPVQTNWKKGSQLVTIDGREVTVNDLEVGGVLTVFPKGYEGSSPDQVILIRLAESLQQLTSPGRTDWGVLGYVAYSKMCTHLGCPVGLYQEQTQQLVCPCHQSIFNVVAGALPEFGPAPRPLPQLPITVDAAGFLRANGSASTSPSGPDSGSAHDRRVASTSRFAGSTTGWAWPRAAGPSSTRSSPTTGPSCWARSPSTRLWCCWPRACSSPSTTCRPPTRSSTTARTSPCGASGSPRPTPRRSGLSFDVRSGLLMRQAHHWAADIFLGSIAVHMARVFFTGAFRKPREFNWIVGVTMLILGIVNGFLGYSLPDDLVSGTGIRIAYSIIESIPLVGSYIAFFLFGGNYPGNGVIIPRFFILHVLIVPLIIIGCWPPTSGLLVKQKHTQFPGKGKTEHNVVGSPMFPTFMAKTTGFLFMVTAVIFLLGGFAQINPIWQFGQYEPYQISYAVQPDWYMGWLDGALRIMPSWEWVGWGHTIPLEVFLPGGHLPRPHLQHPHRLAVHREQPHQGPGVPQPPRPAPRPSQADGGRCRHAHPAGYDLLRLVHRRVGQLLPAAPEGRAVVLPHRRGGLADHRLRGLQDLPGDAGRRGNRQAQAGPHRGTVHLR